MRKKKIKYYTIPQDLPPGLYKCKLKTRWDGRKILTVYIDTKEGNKNE